jgi:hypothetical protein
VCTGTGKYIITRDTTIHIVNVSEDKTNTCDYTIKITRIKSDNVKLSHITLITADNTEIPVELKADVTEYAATVENSVDSVEINVETEDPNASVDDINGVKQLSVGENRFEFTVTAENGNQTAEYTLLITRKAVSAGISKVAASTVQVYFAGQAMHIYSPVAERISVYSVTGVLLQRFDKQAGSSAVSPTGLPTNRIVIIKGRSGWARKIVVND